MSHSMGNDKIYDELRGYFPPEYDLTPDELEKEIELENKKREIALSMMRVRYAEEEQADTEAEKPRRQVRSAVSAVGNSPAPAEAAEKRSTVFDAETELITAEEEESEVVFANADDASISEETFIREEEEEIFIPEAEPVDNIELFSGYEPLNELFDEMEDDSPADELSESEKNTRKNVLWFYDFLEVFSICIACIIVVFALFFRLTRVSGESMEDTLFENEYLIVSDLFYEPECGDIVVLQNTGLTNEKLREPLVKRVIAVGGQSVDISQNGMVSVTDAEGNTTVLDQPYIKSEPYSKFSLSGHYKVPEGHVFVMGDNRNHSTDSRSPMVGVVDERCIFGKALVRILPLNTFTIFENPYK